MGISPEIIFAEINKKELINTSNGLLGLLESRTSKYFKEITLEIRNLIDICVKQGDDEPSVMSTEEFLLRSKMCEAINKYKKTKRTKN